MALQWIKDNIHSFKGDGDQVANLTSIVGQFGTRQFSTGQFGSKIIKRTTWHQDNKNRQFGTKQFGTRTIWHPHNKKRQFGTKEKLRANYSLTI